MAEAMPQVIYATRIQDVRRVAGAMSGFCFAHRVRPDDETFVRADLVTALVRAQGHLADAYLGEDREEIARSWAEVEYAATALQKALNDE